MAEVIYMPKLSDTMTEGVVAEWHKKVGETVENGDLLAEIETDKATMEFESFQEGVLLHIGVEAGATAPVDSVLAILGEKGEDISKVLEEEKKKAASVPKEEKEEIAAPPVLSVSAPVKTSSTPVSAAKTAPVVAAPAPSGNEKVTASPLARKLAEERNLPLARIPGSGDGGRIIKRDVENFIPGGVVDTTESFEEVGVSQMRKVIASRLSESLFTAPHFYLTLDIDMDNAIAARKSVIDFTGQKISFNDIVVKATAKALKRHP
ncbi:MAG: pyruvate dehydrogenase E2 component (dihydrolipoamide acetyltransferase), partial [Saprospiraceae bacterium]